MEFRVTDEIGWEFLFEAGDHQALAIGVKRGWDAYIQDHPHEKAPLTHPAFALGARMAEINRWLEERLSREGATKAQVSSWEAQAQHWRVVAKSKLGGSTQTSPLRLHVFGDASGDWLSPTNVLPAPKVARVLTDEQATFLIQKAERMVEHDRNIMGTVDWVSAVDRKLRLVEEIDENPKAIKASLLEW